MFDAIKPDPAVLVPRLDLADLCALPCDVVTLESRRGGVALCTQADKSSPRGAVHVAFCNYEAAINKFTNSALDPFGKILEFEYYAIQIRVGNEVTLQTSYRGGQILR